MISPRRSPKLALVLASVAAIALLGTQFMALHGPFVKKAVQPVQRRSAQISNPEIAGYVRILEGPGDSDAKRNALRKLQSLGPRASPVIPYLLDVLANPQREEGSLLSGAIRTLELLRGEEVMNELIQQLDRDDGGRFIAASLLMRYGKQASAAIPKLVGKHGITPTAARTLAAIDPDNPQLPARLSELAISPQLEPEVRLNCLEALGWLGPRATRGVETISSLLNPARTQGALLSSSQLSDAEVWQGAVITTLGQIGPLASNAVERLKPFLTNSSVTLRVTAARSLWQITADPQPLVPELTRILEEERIEGPAFIFHFNAGLPNPAPIRTFTVIFPCCNDRQFLTIASAALYLLGEMGPAAQEGLPPVKRIMKNNEDTPGLETLFAARAISRITSNHSDFLRLLLELLQADSREASYVRVAVIHFLSEFGAAAHPAIPRLEALSNSDDLVIAVTATNALKQIRLLANNREFPRKAFLIIRLRPKKPVSKFVVDKSKFIRYAINVI